MSGRHRASAETCRSGNVTDQDRLPPRIPGVAWEQLAASWLSQPGDPSHPPEPWQPEKSALQTLARIRVGLGKL
jgi:hypothetical protein